LGVIKPNYCYFQPSDARGKEANMKGATQTWKTWVKS